ncbi:hypothetical protein GM30_05785 [Trabulsiella odontotermitis]|nr:hypothetical protein GM30_05785 [Trabulsiella odontotermitis]
MSAIAHRYNLKAQVSELLMDIEIDHADQTEESDMSFLTRMAEMLGAIATVKNGYLLFILPQPVSPARAATGTASASPTGTPTPAFARTGWISILAKRKPSASKSARLQHQRKRQAQAARATIWRALTATFT